MDEGPGVVLRQREKVGGVYLPSMPCTTLTPACHRSHPLKRCVFFRRVGISAMKRVRQVCRPCTVSGKFWFNNTQCHVAHKHKRNNRSGLHTWTQRQEPRNPTRTGASSAGVSGIQESHKPAPRLLPNQSPSVSPHTPPPCALYPRPHTGMRLGSVPVIDTTQRTRPSLKRSWWSQCFSALVNVTRIESPKKLRHKPERWKKHVVFHGPNISNMGRLQRELLKPRPQAPKNRNRH